MSSKLKFCFFIHITCLPLHKNNKCFFRKNRTIKQKSKHEIKNTHIIDKLPMICVFCYIQLLLIKTYNITLYKKPNIMIICDKIHLFLCRFINKYPIRILALFCYVLMGYTISLVRKEEVKI